MQSPWASGPAEILRHGLALLGKDTDTNRRLAMISIDNAVELTIKTYLGLPKRITGLKITRNEYQEFAESFPKLLDALEKYAEQKLEGINLGEIEWYHRLRNQLYHQGNGLTVERDKVEVYAQLANVLFASLFDIPLLEADDNDTELLGDFMLAWSGLERTLTSIANVHKISTKEKPIATLQVIQALTKQGVLSEQEAKLINDLRIVRNDVVHAKVDYRKALNLNVIRSLKQLTRDLQRF